MLDYKKAIADAIAARDSTIPAEFRLSKDQPLPQNVSGLVESSGILDQKELQIVELSATELRDAIATKQYTAVAVTTAYLKAAAIAQQATNCLVELLAKEALERAQSLDEEFEKTGQVTGPLHGVPVSIKVCTCLEGCSHTGPYRRERPRLPFGVPVARWQEDSERGRPHGSYPQGSRSGVLYQ